jgi:hypothetical protein
MYCHVLPLADAAIKYKNPVNSLSSVNTELSESRILDA